MKTEAQIKDKLTQVRFRHLKREIRTGLSKKSSNCAYNGRVSLPVYGEVGVCLYGAESRESWNGGVCDEAVGQRAGTCDLFVCLRSKEDLKTEFDDFLKTSTRAEVAAQYPDMAALLWVLDKESEEILEVPGSPAEEETEPPAPSEESLPTMKMPPPSPVVVVPGPYEPRVSVVFQPTPWYMAWFHIIAGWFRG